jgi:hypothetical protein
MTEFYDFLGGMITTGHLVAALFFLRFWRGARDKLFLAFAAAFFLLGVNQAMVTLTNMPIEERSPLYLVRLAAFALILLAIWNKNRTRM